MIIQYTCNFLNTFSKKEFWKSGFMYKNQTEKKCTIYTKLKTTKKVSGIHLFAFSSIIKLSNDSSGCIFSSKLLFIFSTKTLSFLSFRYSARADLHASFHTASSPILRLFLDILPFGEDRGELRGKK
uniref:(northern house mosquito) hypothetical protein n=2 Tax=Culex pipiens TaxID=7175 RepID=A0A8D8FSA2_CULPI